MALSIKEKIALMIKSAEQSHEQGERDIFMAKALELMEKHQIEAWELHTDDPIAHTNGVQGQPGMASYKPMVQRALGKFYGCEVVQEQLNRKDYRMVLFGPESARMTTELMTPFVWEQVLREGKQWARDHHLADAKGIRMVAKALCIRIDTLIAQRAPIVEEKRAGFALMVVDQTKQYIDRHFGELSTMRCRPTRTAASAVERAGNISINHQMRDSHVAGRLN